MKKLKTNQIINGDTLNIFTDASISKLKNMDIVVGGAGSNFYIGDSFVGSDIRILFNTTNNESEITSILLGVMGAIQLRHDYSNISSINLFSDSKISVFGLREWIFSWIRSIRDDVMYSSSGQPVANQKIILSIVNIIDKYDLYINIFHVRGHLDSGSQKNVTEFKKSFVRENKLDIDDYLVDFLIFGNSSIDNYTRSKLYDVEYMNIAQRSLNNIIPINIDQSYYLQNTDFINYSKCIGGNK